MSYSSIRPETHSTRDFLLMGLERNPGVIRIWNDGSDLIVAVLASGHKVMITLIDDAISMHEIQKMVANHQSRGFHSLIMFWADMLLPNDGERYLPDDWMAAMLALYGDKIYGYDIDSQH